MVFTIVLPLGMLIGCDQDIGRLEESCRHYSCDNYLKITSHMFANEGLCDCFDLVLLFLNFFGCLQLYIMTRFAVGTNRVSRQRTCMSSGMPPAEEGKVLNYIWKTTAVSAILSGLCSALPEMPLQVEVTWNLT